MRIAPRQLKRPARPRSHARGAVAARASRLRRVANLSPCRFKPHPNPAACARLESISQDPIGFAAGDANVSRYVGNQVLNALDPSGLDDIAGQINRWQWAHQLAVAQKFVRTVRWYHWNRNLLNPPAPSRIPVSPNLGSSNMMHPEWPSTYPMVVVCPDWQSACHQFGGGKNSKLITYDGFGEAVYDDQGMLVTDPANLGTYNYIGVQAPYGHGLVDVIPWIVWGNTPDDPTNSAERLGAVIGAIGLEEE